MPFFSEGVTCGKSQVTWREACFVPKNTGSNQLSQAVVMRLKSSGCCPSGARTWTVMSHSVR